MSDMLPKTEENLVREDLSDFSSFEKPVEKAPEKKKRSLTKALVYLLIIFVLTGVALFLSLKDNYDAVTKTIGKVNIGYLFLMLSIVLFSYVLDGLAIFLFSRLYTHKYKLHQGIATSFIGAFYTSVAPSKSAGQVMEVYTMNKQGVATSNAASIMVMSFIVYELSIVIISAVGLFVNKFILIDVGELNIFGWYVTSVPLILIGFSVHFLLIAGLIAMSYSRHFHNLILNHGIDFLAKLKLIKNPEQRRESLRIQVENFKIELRRLLSNVPIFLLMIVIFSIVLMLRFSIPYLTGLALDGFGFKLNADGSLFIQTIEGGKHVAQTVGTNSFESCMQGIFLSSFTQLLTSIIPIPGGAGISEYFFSSFFKNYYNSQSMIVAAQIVWRFTTFLFVIVVSGMVTALYRASPKDEFHQANRKNYVTLQYATFNERQYEDNFGVESVFTFKKLGDNFKQMMKPKSRTKLDEKNEVNQELLVKNEEPVPIKKVKKKPPKKVKQKVVQWKKITIGDDDE